MKMLLLSLTPGSINRINNATYKMLINVWNDEECDATDDDSSIVAG
jgi:hypothetical protein